MPGPLRRRPDLLPSLSILFMTEIVAGVASPAILTEETFDLRELAGTLMILGAGLVEVLRPPDAKREASV